MTLAAGPSAQGDSPGPGISRALAAARAELVRNVRYELRFVVEEGTREVSGRAVVQFDLPEDRVPDAPVILDYAGRGLADVRINQVPQEGGVRRVHGHLILPAETLVPGRNRFSAAIRSTIAATGTPVSVYQDPTDAAEYYYTLLVPADAHRLFPCFDQPDLKAVLALELEVPPEWRAVSNAALREEPRRIGRRVRFSFADTAPLSTYLMAFAAGPFAVVEDGGAGTTPLRIFLRRSRLERLEAAALFEMHAAALEHLADYFAAPYPFGKLDLVLLPGFPYGGMEHAGAIFYRESALVFDHPPTAGERTRRSTLVYHEVSHQWFGNLVSFVWFDDLWLKEGFATWMSYRLLDALEPDKQAWLRFHQRVKPRALVVDATAGTTAIWQRLDNLADAKSAYGAIVYNKAPAVLRELEVRLGAEPFRRGLRRFVERYAFGNARWSDLVAALQGVTRQDLSRWSERWILAAGLPRVRLHLTVESGKIARAELRQESVQGGSETWPLRVELAVRRGATRETLVVESDAPSVEIEALRGAEIFDYCLLDPRSAAYGLFLPDPRSTEWLLDHLRLVEDPLERTVAQTQLFDAVREGELDPARFAGLAVARVRVETDPETHGWVLARLGTTLSRYLEGERRKTLRSAAVDAGFEVLRGEDTARKLQTLRFLAWRGEDERVLTLCQRILDGTSEIRGLEPGARDRYLLLAALLAAGRAGDRPARLRRSLEGEDIARHEYVAGAAAADPAVKKRYFASYLRADGPPEQWVAASLPFFHWPGQEELTLPYLRRALDRVEWVKRHRKIFFMPAWIDGFINGHSSPEALAQVEAWLAEHTDLAPDIHRKVLQSLDKLRRAVKIKARWR